MAGSEKAFSPELRDKTYVASRIYQHQVYGMVLLPKYVRISIGRSVEIFVSDRIPWKRHFISSNSPINFTNKEFLNSEIVK